MQPSAPQPASCGDFKPISSPGQRFTCPALSEYDEAHDETQKPSAQACCRPATCANLQPISKPGIKFVCPADMRFNPEAENASKPGTSTCCQVSAEGLQITCWMVALFVQSKMPVDWVIPATCTAVIIDWRCRPICPTLLPQHGELSNASKCRSALVMLPSQPSDLLNMVHVSVLHL